jgi:hypothetical protein
METIAHNYYASMEKLKNSSFQIIPWITFLLFLSISSLSWAQTEEEYGEISFDTLSFDVGKVDKTIKTVTVNYTNAGPGKLTIYHAVTPCTCTSVNFSKDAINKGKKGKITIQIDPTKLPIGPFSRTVTILHDGSEQGHDQVTITGIRQ